MQLKQVKNCTIAFGSLVLEDEGPAITIEFQNPFINSKYDE